MRWRQHGKPHLHLGGWLAHYEAGTPGVEAGDNATARLDLANEPQPDLLLIVSPECGGQVRISANDYIEGAPEMVAEVAASSAAMDLDLKFNAYRRNGVREYLVWRVATRTVDWFVLRGGQFERLAAAADGIFRSEVFPGLWLDPAALVQFKLATVLAVLQQGIGTPAHAAFVTRLSAARTSTEA